ncbi:hypothetical protein K505DRAFT_370266 [Melanomma pulvis-pyrius CBS 109.77]|uniref:Uncharacterized protein n=1 Tax=Melanomma pulvis-pyrius CBS 109.77 TaxID=1314802 RepID=A0A6A6XX87_9PLEO|nr:hypothetical protein K505DRAFT_370266 [Melanomma pulvis-pyrius CBS 109.77]
MAFTHNTTPTHYHQNSLSTFTMFASRPSQERSREDPPSPPPQPPPSPVNWSRSLSDLDDMSLELIDEPLAPLEI